MAAATPQYYWFPCLLMSLSSKVKIYQQTIFRRHISIRGWNITTFVLEKKTNVWTTYWNSTSGLDFDYITAIGMLFCIKMPNFIHIGPPAAEIWRHIDSSRWRPRLLNTTSGFVFVDATAFRRSKSISQPNFVYKRPPYWNSTSGFVFDHFTVIGVHWKWHQSIHHNLYDLSVLQLQL